MEILWLNKMRRKSKRILLLNALCYLAGMKLMMAYHQYVFQIFILFFWLSIDFQNNPALTITTLTFYYLFSPVVVTTQLVGRFDFFFLLLLSVCILAWLFFFFFFSDFPFPILKLLNFHILYRFSIIKISTLMTTWSWLPSEMLVLSISIKRESFIWDWQCMSSPRLFLRLTPFLFADYCIIYRWSTLLSIAFTIAGCFALSTDQSIVLNTYWLVVYAKNIVSFFLYLWAMLAITINCLFIALSLSLRLPVMSTSSI